MCLKNEEKVYTVRGNNSTNTNKKNTKSPQTIEHKENTMTYDVENPGPGLGQTQAMWLSLLLVEETGVSCKKQPTFH